MQIPSGMCQIIPVSGVLINMSPCATFQHSCYCKESQKSYQHFVLIQNWTSQMSSERQRGSAQQNLREGQREKYIKKNWDRVLSYTTRSKISLLKNAIIVFFCLWALYFFRSLHESNKKTFMFSMQTSGYFKWTTYKDLLWDLGICWWVFLCTKTELSP